MGPQLKMRGRERVWSALRKKSLDKPPKGEILITDDFIKKFPGNDLEAVVTCINADLVTLPVDKPFLRHQWRYWCNKDYFIFGLVQGPLNSILDQVGWANLSRLIVKSPEKTEKLIDELVSNSLPQIDTALDCGCDGIIIADDLAGNQGLLVSPAFLEKHYFPPIATFLTELNCKDVPFLFHSDGNVSSIVPRLLQTGFWGIQSLQPSVDLRAASFPEELLSDWCFWGNVEFEYLIELKTVSQIEKEVFATLKSWAATPGYIFGSSGGLYHGLSPATVKIGYAAVDKWGIFNKQKRSKRNG